MEYKLYKNKYEFMEDNNLANDNFLISIELAFFKTNILKYESFDINNYAFKFTDENNYLLILKVDPYNMLLFGSDKLTSYAAGIIANYHLNVSNALGEEKLINSFYDAYQKYNGGKIEIVKNMSIMYCKKLPSIVDIEVINCSKNDLEDLAKIFAISHLEFYKESITLKQAMEKLSNLYQNFYALKIDGKFVSIAYRKESYDNVVCISNVYTLPFYRKKGYAFKVVNKMTYDILNENRIPYLFVEKDNLAANRLYNNIGYRYYKSYYQIYFK